MSGLLQFPTGILVLVFLTYFVSAVLDLLSIFIAFLHKRGLALRTFYWESLFVLFAVNLLFGFLLPAIGPVAADDAEYVLLLPLLLALAGIFFQRRYLLVFDVIPLVFLLPVYPDSVVRGSLALASCLLFFLEATHRVSWAKEHYHDDLSIFTVKLALDEVSDGLLFARKNGEVIFINEPMKRIFLSLGITPYRKEAQLWEAIETHSLRAFGDRLLLQSGDKFYLFEKIQGNGQESQIVASDVTEEEFYTEELERNRKELLKVRAQLLSTLKALEDIEKEKEQVKIRSRFHDALGERISLLHVLLLDPEELHDLTPLRESLSHMSEELVSEEEATQGEDLGSLLSSFAAIGVKIVIDGALPEDREKREVLLKILREASTNAVRHASATEVVMKNRREVGAFESTFTNNGDPVVGPIREGTGFRGMRDSAKKLGGDVRISADPNLIIVVDLPER